MNIVITPEDFERWGVARGEAFSLQIFYANGSATVYVNGVKVEERDVPCPN